jgi:hypothetical protein
LDLPRGQDEIKSPAAVICNGHTGFLGYYPGYIGLFRFYGSKIADMVLREYPIDAEQ